MFGFAEEVLGTLPELRALAESLMTSTLRVTRLDPATIDRRTGEGERVTVYEGRGKVQTYEPYESDRERVSGTVVVQRYHVHVPVTAGPFEVGDLVEVVASPTMPHAVGDVFRVAGLHEKSHQTAQRLLADEITNVREVAP